MKSKNIKKATVLLVICNNGIVHSSLLQRQERDPELLPLQAPQHPHLLHVFNLLH